MAIVGALIIVRWLHGLLTQTGLILLDGSIEGDYQRSIKESIEKDADNRIADIHVWKVGAQHYAAIIALVTHYPKSAEHYKQLLSEFDKLFHVTIQVNECREDPCVVPDSGIAWQTLSGACNTRHICG